MSEEKELNCNLNECQAAIDKMLEEMLHTTVEINKTFDESLVGLCVSKRMSDGEWQAAVIENYIKEDKS